MSASLIRGGSGLPLTGGTVTGDILGNGIRIGPATADGADNSFMIFGHSGGTRGARFQAYGNEHANAGQARVTIGGLGTFRVYGSDDTSILFQVDGNSGNTSASYALSAGSVTTGGITTTAPLQLTGTQTSAGASVANIYRDSGGNMQFNVAANCGFGFSNNAAGFPRIAVRPDNGVVLQGTQTSLGGSVTSIYRDSSGNLVHNVDSGLNHSFTANGTAAFNVTPNGVTFPSLQNASVFTVPIIWRDLSGFMRLGVPSSCAVSFDVNGASQAYVNSAGLNLSANHQSPGNSAYGVWRESTFKQAVFQGPTDGVAHLYGAGTGINGSSFKAHGETNASRPACLTVRSGGKNYTNNGTWTNFYSLDEGTHYGTFFVYSNGYKSYYQFSIANTTIAEEYQGWGGSIGNSTGSPSSTQIGFRISGGWIQINVGTSIASNLFYHGKFEGSIR